MAPRGPNDEEGVVDPEDLDITANEHVDELREGQYVIATGDRGLDEAELERMQDELAGDGESEASDDVDPRAVLADRLTSFPAANGFVVGGRFEGDVVDVHEHASDDPAAVFADLLGWYAANVDDDTPEAEVLGILAVAGGVRIRYPTRALVDVLRTHGLSPDDSIRDLLGAVDGEGFVLPADADDVKNQH
jgi:hypothetical protein